MLTARVRNPRPRAGDVIPTLAEMRDRTRIPERIRQRLGKVLLRDADPVSLLRITWKNDPKTGLFNDGNWLEFPPELTGIDARIVGVVR